MVERPITLRSIFPTWTISHLFKTYEDMEKWMDERKLTLVSSVQVGEYLCCLAKSEDVEKVEIVL